jgi:hypothetical protein
MSKRVTVVMRRNDIFPWQSGTNWEASLLHTPSGPGDTFRLRVEQPEREFAADISEYVGTKLELNGNSLDFIGSVDNE